MYVYIDCYVPWLKLLEPFPCGRRVESAHRFPCVLYKETKTERWQRVCGVGLRRPPVEPLRLQFNAGETAEVWQNAATILKPLMPNPLPIPLPIWCNILLTESHQSPVVSTPLPPPLPLPLKFFYKPSSPPPSPSIYVHKS